MMRLPPRPDLSWTEDGAPQSRRHDDIYFSRAGGLSESSAVFLDGCGLPDAWANRGCFVIAELGFGSGLNFLATWRAWAAGRRPGQILHFFSIEGFPLEREEAARVHAAFPEVAALSQRLLARWPARARGVQRLWFPEDGLCLTLHHEPAEIALARMEGPVDAWFLDGFAPARNPDMWSPALLQRVGALSAADARLATYTVAGDVRRALAAAGFDVEKKPGFAGKRERLEARRSGLRAATASAPQPVAVIGAGIAGASVACALNRRGRSVVVLEAGPGPASGASGNPVGLVTPRLDRTETATARLFLAAYLHALDLYAALGLLGPDGVRTLARDARAVAAFQSFAVDPPLPETHLQVEDGALFHVRAGPVRPRDVVARLLGGAEVRASSCVDKIERDGDAWRILDASGATMILAGQVVIAAGASLPDFKALEGAPLERIAGQMEWGAPDGPVPAHALEKGSYLAPWGDTIAFGATYDRISGETAAETGDARARNLAALAALAPEVAARLRPETVHSRASVRLATPDRTPVCGALGEGLFVLGALGSRGLSLAPLLAENLVARLCGEPPLLDADMRAVIAPDRFAKRASRRGDA